MPFEQNTLSKLAGRDGIRAIFPIHNSFEITMKSIVFKGVGKN